MIWSIRSLVITATLILVAGSAWYAYESVLQKGRDEIQAKWDAERALQMAAQAESQMKARQTEQALRKTIDRLRKEKVNEANRLAAQYAADLDRVRNRPEARATDGGVPKGAVAGVGCTGAGLSRSDSEFLVWLGAEAARTQAALNTCVSAYDAVRREINGE